VLQPDGLWVVFWTQPADSDSLCTRLTREFLIATIPGYSPQAALDLEGKHTLPEALPFQVDKVAINYRSVCPLSQYVASVTSWSFVANAIHNLPEIQQFKAGLYQRLVNAGIDQVVEEQMRLTVLLASRKDDPVQIALVS
jgi:hypothetical protein